MDQPTRTTKSSIPRLSKLPVPRSSRILSNGSDQAPQVGSSSVLAGSASFGLSSRPRPTANKQSARTGPLEEPHTLGTALKNNDEPYQQLVGPEVLPRNPSASETTPMSPSKPPGSPTDFSEARAGASLPGPRLGRNPRPSLSDRTVETLFQIPPSPSTNRRKSAFFTGESPMQPPSRPGSAMTHSRPGSRANGPLSPIKIGERPSSPYKRQTISHRTGQSGISTPGNRATSSYVPRGIPKPAGTKFESGIPTSPSQIQPPNLLPLGLQSNSKGPRLSFSSKTYAGRQSKAKTPVQALFKGPLLSATVAEESPGDAHQKKLQPCSPTKKAVSSSLVLPKHSSNESKSSEIDPAPNSDSWNISTSSQSLRETIARAKAAKRMASKEAPKVPRSVDTDQVANIAPEADPFSFDLSGNTNNNLLRKRINMARTDGKLNIAALGLSTIPKEVLSMYETGSNDFGGPAWYENVDLQRLIAADNEITELGEDTFPDIDMEPSNDHDEESPNTIFGGLEMLDLHGNHLRAIPLGFRRLSRLTFLNLSRNQITSEIFTVIREITSLKELKLAENTMQGALPEGLCDLINLETLDVHGNALSDFPTKFEYLSKLKILNIAGNNLFALPFNAMSKMSLVEIMASGNRLSGTLIPFDGARTSTLQTLDVSQNALLSIVDGYFEAPMLQSLNVSNNRLTALPELKAMEQLSTLAAMDNQIRALPDGFTTLKQLKHVDISGNNLSNLDNAVGNMDQLVVLRISGNPIRERKLMNISTEDLKSELRDRLSLQEPTHGSTDSPQAKPEKLRAVSNWPVSSSGVVDASNKKLRVLELSDFEALAAEAMVKTLILRQNQLQQIYQPIELLGTSLATLDMSHNKLGQKNTYLTESLVLPTLQTLNLTSNALTSLQPLTEHLVAPRLATLILSFNRLPSLPRLCSTFPTLSTVLASNNSIVELNVENVHGLQTLDVSSNEIAHLPPRLALLQGQLKTFMVGGNKFRVPGWGVLEKGTEEILNWCRKRIPVGEEGAPSDDDVD